MIEPPPVRAKADLRSGAFAYLFSSSIQPVPPCLLLLTPFACEQRRLLCAGVILCLRAPFFLYSLTRLHCDRGQERLLSSRNTFCSFNALANMDRITAMFMTQQPAKDGDSTDRLNYYHTPLLLTIFAVFNFTWAFVGRPLECWFPAYYKSEFR